MLSIDCGLILDGWQSDSAFTVGVGASARKPQAHRGHGGELLQGCAQGHKRQSSWGYRQRHSDYAESFGYGVIRDLTGHGIGRAMHEEPSVGPTSETGPMAPGCRPGMTLAVEPMIAMGDYHVAELEDGWTIVTEDAAYARTTSIPSPSTSTACRSF